MVDALCRARRWLIPPHGVVVDLRPADVAPDVEMGLGDGTILHIGRLVVEQERRARHAAADEAVRVVVRRGLFTIQPEEQFSFFYYPDSPDELREYIATKWRSTRVDDATHARALAAVRAHPDGRLWMREQVKIKSLSPFCAFRDD